jgi:transcriptional regulator with XRE-family HTH domain
VNGEQIRQLREARGLTQQQLAAALGVGARTIGGWERDETVPKNRMGMLRQFFGLDSAESDDPIRGASDVTLLAELMRRAAAREAATG